MGNKLPNDLVNAERTKLNPVEGVFIRKKYNLEQFSGFEDDQEWEKVIIRIYQSRLECTVVDRTETIIINHEFIIMSQSSSLKEVTFAMMADKKIWKLQASCLRDFLDLTTCLVHSKVPTWSISPICQVCSKDFNIASKKHHCRNCGKVTCNKCTVKSSFNFEGFSKISKVCKSCLDLINSQIIVIRDLNRSILFQSESCNKSVISRNSKN
jgi:hypothetical protein